jgi:hypothetical protein
MAGMGPAPKPDGERARRNASTFSWVELPSTGRKGKPPLLPKWRMWDARTERWWADLWKKPQALMWEQDGSTLTTLACLVDDLVTGRAEASKVSAEMRQHEDRHGLNPRAMLQLRWRIVNVEATAPTAPKARRKKAAPATVTPLDERRARVRGNLKPGS